MKTAIITGASSGIGLATAIKLKSEGYNVVGSYLTSEETAKAVELKYGIPFIKCDVSSESGVEALFSYAEKRFGKVTLVIANAGVALKQSPLLDVSEKDIDRVISTNLKGAILTNKRAVLSMLNGGGRIVNISSIFGLLGGSCEVPYSATKAGVIGLTKALAEETSSSNIEVLAVALGLVDTPMNAHLSQEDKLDFCKECNLDKIPSASDTANELYKIISSSENLNGQIITVFAG